MSFVVRVRVVQPDGVGYLARGYKGRAASRDGRLTPTERAIALDVLLGA